MSTGKCSYPYLIAACGLLTAAAAPAMGSEAAGTGHAAAMHETVVHEAAFPASSRGMLNNEGLVLLARAGYNERFLAELVRTKPSKFDTSVEGLVYLAKQGISERLVRAILVREREEEARQAIEESEPFDLAPSGAGAAAAKPVRLKVVKRGVLVPADPGASIAPGAVIVEERGAYWAKPASTGRL